MSMMCVSITGVRVCMRLCRGSVSTAITESYTGTHVCLLCVYVCLLCVYVCLLCVYVCLLPSLRATRGRHMPPHVLLLAAAPIPGMA